MPQGVGGAINSSLRDLIAAENGGDGVRLKQGRIERVLSRNNGGVGILALSDVVVVSCASELNDGNGIEVRTGCTVQNCVSSKNTPGSGFVVTGGASTFGGCIAVENGGSGFVGSGAELSANACTARLNSGNGFQLFDNCLLTNCTAMANVLSGIIAHTDEKVPEYYRNVHVTACAASNNTRDGIALGDMSSATNCNASSNGWHGITVNYGCSVIGCHASLNGITPSGATLPAGIRAGSSCRISGNTCVGNYSTSTSGITSTGGGNYITDNFMTDNNLQLYITTNGNIISRNAAMSPFSGYILSGSNDVGPIDTAASASSPTVNIDN